MVNRNIFVALKYALHDYPYSPEVYYYYAKAYYLNGDWRRATKCLRKTFYFDPEYVDALVFKGDMNYDFGMKTGWHVTSRFRLDKIALEAYEAAAHLSRDTQSRAMLFLKMGDVYADLARNEKEARRYWRKCISTAPNSKAAFLASERMS